MAGDGAGEGDEGSRDFASAELAAAFASMDAERARRAFQAGASADDAVAGHFRPPLSLAIRARSAPMARAALEAGADMGLEKAGELVSAMVLALVTVPASVDVLAALIQAGADVDCPSGDGSAPLHWAVRTGDAAMVRMLLDAGAKVQALDGVGHAPLSLAISLRQEPPWLECVAVLAKADPGSGQALRRAVLSDSVAAIRILAGHGFDMDFAGRGEPAPLVIAAKADKFEAAEALLDAGASAVDPATGRSEAAEAAQERGHARIAELIRTRIRVGVEKDALRAASDRPDASIELGGPGRSRSRL